MTKSLFHEWRNLCWRSNIFFSDTLRSSGNTARETPNPSDRPIYFSPSDSFFIHLFKYLDDVFLARPTWLNPSILNPHLLTPRSEKLIVWSPSHPTLQTSLVGPPCIVTYDHNQTSFTIKDIDIRLKSDSSFPKVKSRGGWFGERERWRP